MSGGRPSHGPEVPPLNLSCICFTSCAVLTNGPCPNWEQAEPGTSLVLYSNPQLAGNPKGSHPLYQDSQYLHQE